jgi:hypothetical protein
MTQEVKEKGIYIRLKIPTLDGKDFDSYGVDFNDKSEEFQCPSLVFKKRALVCTTTKAFVLNKLIGGLQNIFHRASIILKPDGIRLTETDKDGKMFISIHLYASRFLNYYCPDSFHFPVDMKSFAEKLQGTKKVMNLLTLSCPSPDKLDLEILDEKTNVTVYRSIQRLAAVATGSGAMELGMEATFPFKVIVPVAFLHEVRTKLGKKSGEKRITITATNLFLKFQVGKNVKQYDHIPPLATNGGKEINEKFDMDFCYWKKMVVLMNKLKLYKNSKASLHFCSKHPFIYVSQEVGNLGLIGYVLSKAEK